MAFTLPEVTVMVRGKLVINMRNKSLGVLRSEKVREFAPRPIGLAEVGPSDGMEARVPEPLERIDLGVGDGVALRSPVGLEHSPSRGPNHLGIGR